jgi:L-aspartate semialdehyde sulfurtransferase ferredoxin
MQVKFSFPPELVSQPVVHQLGKRFNVVINIRRADIGRESGWAILDIYGEPEVVDQALAWASAQGVVVESIDSEGY